MMQHTPEELALLKAAVLANQTALAARDAGDVATLLAWLNAPTATSAWKVTVLASELFGSLTINTYDSITAGKRDAFNLLLQYGPVNASKQAIRNGLADIFNVVGAYTDSGQLAKMLNGACVEFASNAQVALGYTTPAPVGGVTAIKRVFSGSCDESTANWLINN